MRIFCLFFEQKAIIYGHADSNHYEQILFYEK